MEYKYGTVFREVMTTGRLEICSLLKNFELYGMKPKQNQQFSPIHIILNMTYEVIHDSVDPKLIHSCPYYGVLEYNNISMKTANFFSIFPSGEYRVTLIFSNKVDPKIFELKFWHTVKSSIITSF